jgi:urease accessory protein
MSAESASSAGIDAAALLRLLHLASPALPIGAFAYSQGLEPATAAGTVTNEDSAADWILGVIEHSLTTLDVPVFARLYQAFAADDQAAAQRWTDHLFAARGSAELQAEDQRLGSALAKVLVTLGLDHAAPWAEAPRVTHATLFALAAAHWRLPLAAGACALLFAWCENQTAAAMRLVPLGQSSGLRILARAHTIIPGIVSEGLALPDDEMGWGCPGLALGSALHETQYSRLFRS